MIPYDYDKSAVRVGVSAWIGQIFFFGNHFLDEWKGLIKIKNNKKWSESPIPKDLGNKEIVALFLVIVLN